MPAASASGGGGGSAGDVRSGGAYYEIVGRDGVSKVLDSIGDKVKTFGGIMDKVGAKSFLSSFAGGLTGGIIGGGLSDMLTKGGEALADWATNAKLAATEAERMERAFKAAAEAAAKIYSGRVSDITAEGRRVAGLEADPRKGADKLRDAITLLEAERTRITDAMAGAAARETTPDEYGYGPHGERYKKTDKSDVRAAAKLAKEAYGGEIGKLSDEMKKLGDEAFALEASRGKVLFDPIIKLKTSMADAVDPMEKFRGTFEKLVRDMSRDPKYADPAFEFDFEKLTKAAIKADDAIKGTKGTFGKLIEDAVKKGKELDLFKWEERGGGRMFQGMGALLARGVAGAAQLATQMVGLPTEVRGGFASGMSAQQFGYGSSARDQTELLKKINDGSGNLPDAIGSAVALAMTFK